MSHRNILQSNLSQRAMKTVEKPQNECRPDGSLAVLGWMFVVLSVPALVLDFLHRSSTTDWLIMPISAAMLISGAGFLIYQQPNRQAGPISKETNAQGGISYQPHLWGLPAQAGPFRAGRDCSRNIGFLKGINTHNLECGCLNLDDMGAEHQNSLGGRHRLLALPWSNSKQP